MTTRDGFLRAGHLPTLVAALLYFDVSFMAWVLLGPLAPFLRDELGLTATQQGLLTAIPLLGGSLFRPLLGMLGDRIGGRRTGLIGLVLTLVPLAARLAVRAHDVAHFYALGLLARHRRRQLRRGAAAREPLVSAGVSGAGDGHRRRRQFRDAAGDALRAAAGRALRLGDHVRPRDAADGCWCSSSSRCWPRTVPRRAPADAGATTPRCCASPTRCGSRCSTA